MDLRQLQVYESPSSRRAWIEILDIYPKWSYYRVALLAEGVDRNISAAMTIDREIRSPSSRRAWIEIALRAFSALRLDRSPSSRRAWIEIGRRDHPDGRISVALLAEGVDRNNSFCLRSNSTCVALLAEGVDRNLQRKNRFAAGPLSPSSRRAWIEIAVGTRRRLAAWRRPPRGGRG